MQQVTSYPQLLGQVVKFHRKKAALDQAAIAKPLSITGSGWSRIESGETTMTVVQLRKVAASLGKKPWELVKEVDELAEHVERGPIRMQVLDEPPAEGANRGWWLIGGAALFALVAALLAAKYASNGGAGRS